VRLILEYVQFSILNSQLITPLFRFELRTGLRIWSYTSLEEWLAKKCVGEKNDCGVDPNDSVWAQAALGRRKALRVSEVHGSETNPGATPAPKGKRPEFKAQP